MIPLRIWLIAFVATVVLAALHTLALTAVGWTPPVLVNVACGSAYWLAAFTGTVLLDLRRSDR